MKTIEIQELSIVGGGFRWEGGRQSSNVIDWRTAIYRPDYIDVNNMCIPYPTGTVPPGYDTGSDGDGI